MDVSKALCDVCGLEHKRYEVVARACHEDYYSEVTLNFKKPENFIRLYNLPLGSKDTPTVAAFISSDCSIIKNSEDFIKRLVEHLVYDEDADFIKEAIRKAEWTYG